MHGAGWGVGVRHQAVKYVLVAGAVTLGYLLVFSLGLTLRLHYIVAILIAQLLTVTVAFPIYRSFIFESNGRIHTDLLRFLGVWSAGALAGFLLTPLLVEVAGVRPLPAQVAAIVVVAVGSFLGHRFFSFRDNGPHHLEGPMDA